MQTMLYTKEQKTEIERIAEVFGGYIRKSPYLDLVWSDKVGYLLLKISVEYRSLEGESLIIEDAETLCKELFSEIVQDVLFDSGNDNCSMAVDSAEGAEIERRFLPYLDQLPEYGKLAKACYCVDITK